MDTYQKYIKTVVKTIRTKGIPVYVDRFNAQYHDEPVNFSKEDDFLDYMNTIVHFYHPHSYFYKSEAQKNKKNKPTGFSFGADKIAKIQLFSFSSYNGPAKYEVEKKIYIDEINHFLDDSARKGMKGLIIDFSKHGGGGVWQTVTAFERYFNNTTLFAWSNAKVGLNEKKWTNMENGNIVWEKRFLTKDLRTPIPIAVIIGKDTASAGEIVASIFKSSANVRLFGVNSKGLLSMNSTLPIGKMYGLVFTSILQTSKDGTFSEYLAPDVVTKSPLTDAKKWINSY